jgi:hypothetical protein
MTSPHDARRQITPGAAERVEAVIASFRVGMEFRRERGLTEADRGDLRVQNNLIVLIEEALYGG